MPRDCILARIDSALEKMRAQGAGVRAIYLSEPTRDAFDKAMCKELGRKAGTAHFFSHRDHDVRTGKSDVIYSEHGVGFTVPKKLSPRVAEPKSKAA